MASAGTSGVHFPVELLENVGLLFDSWSRRSALVLGSHAHLRHSGNGGREEPRVRFREENASREIGDRVQE
jgi:hypothetical protein